MNVSRQGKTTATVAVSNCRSLPPLAALYRKLCRWKRKRNDGGAETAVVPLGGFLGCFFFPLNLSSLLAG